MENYIEQIRQIMAKTGWSQAKLAQEIGVTFASVNRWLNRHTKPHPAQLQQIEKLFKEIVGVIPIPQPKIKQVMDKVMAKRKKFKNIKQIGQIKEIAAEFLLELTYNSDAIEGSTLTRKETEAIIFDKAVIKEKSLIEHLETTNHASLLRTIFEGRFGFQVNEALIKELHKVLMQGIREDGGEYAKHQRGIRGVNLILPHPRDIPEEMRIFCSKVDKFPRKQPFDYIAKMHADFEAIHPFGDGNGRVGRLIMLIQLINQGFAPPVITVNERAKYYECLEYAQKRSETHLVYFLAKAILKGYTIIEKYR